MSEKTRDFGVLPDSAETSTTVSRGGKSAFGLRNIRSDILASAAITETQRVFFASLTVYSERYRLYFLRHSVYTSRCI